MLKCAVAVLENPATEVSDMEEPWILFRGTLHVPWCATLKPDV